VSDSGRVLGFIKSFTKPRLSSVLEFDLIIWLIVFAYFVAAAFGFVAVGRIVG
jgi:hypothetical protein